MNCFFFRFSLFVFMSHFIAIQNFIFLPSHIFDLLFLSEIGLGKPLKKTHEQ